MRMPEPTAPPQEFSVASTPYGLQGKLLVATPHIGDPPVGVVEGVVSQ